MDEKLKYDTRMGEARLGFSFHVALFLAVNTFLIIVNLHFYTDSLWALWLTGIWILVLLVHGWRTRTLMTGKRSKSSPLSSPQGYHFH